MRVNAKDHHNVDSKKENWKFNIKLDTYLFSVHPNSIVSPSHGQSSSVNFLTNTINTPVKKFLSSDFYKYFTKLIYLSDPSWFDTIIYWLLNELLFYKNVKVVRRRSSNYTLLFSLTTILSENNVSNHASQWFWTQHHRLKQLPKSCLFVLLTTHFYI